MTKNRRMESPTSHELLARDTLSSKKENLFRCKGQGIGIDVKRSIKILDEAMTPTPSVRSMRRRTLMSSSTHGGSPSMKSVLRSSHNVTAAFTSFDESTVFNTTESILDHQTTSSTQFDASKELTTTNVSLMLSDDAGITASTSLFTEFDRCLCQNSAQHQVLDLLSDYHMAVSDQAAVLTKLLRCARLEPARSEKSYSALDLLDKERSTWQLMLSLFRDRMNMEIASRAAQNQQDGTFAEVSRPRKTESSEQMIMTRLFEDDSLLRECQLVVDWLENMALEDMDTIRENAQHFSDHPVAWENTLHYLHNKKDGVSTDIKRPMVDEMDPDAPTRQGRLLDDLDTEDEQRLLHHIFICLRAGQLEKAQELCRSCGQAWRAASLEGWRLFHDPNCTRLQSPIAPTSGNPYRDVWKSVCWRIASEARHDKYEIAIYAALSGHLARLLDVCHTWYDQLWAYLRSLVDVRVEQEVRLRCFTFRERVDLPLQYWDGLMEPTQVFHELETRASEQILSESRHWYHVVQKLIILGDMPGLVDVLYGWVDNTGELLPPQLLRFMAHLVLFLQRVGCDLDAMQCTVVLEAYVRCLIDGKQGAIVANYVIFLPPHLQVTWYSRFLEGVGERGERERCLSLAAEAGLDVPAITKAVVENVAIATADSDILLDSRPVTSVTVTEEDRRMIDSIDWLVFDPAQRGEAMRQANAMMRHFLLQRKHVAARAVFHQLPTDSIDVVYRIWYAKTESTNLPPNDANAIREYTCFTAYLDAVESYGDWFSLFHHGKPSEPAAVPDSGSFVDHVAFEHRAKRYGAELDRWRLRLDRQTQVTKDRLYNVLLFVDGGWMVDKYKKDENSGGGGVGDEVRQKQLTLLRRIHIPALCSNMIHMLQASQHLPACLQLADCVASERHQLYKQFSQEELQQFLRQIRQSSLCLLDNNKDPLGYELV